MRYYWFNIQKYQSYSYSLIFLLVYTSKIQNKMVNTVVLNNNNMSTVKIIPGNWE